MMTRKIYARNVDGLIIFTGLDQTNDGAKSGRPILEASSNALTPQSSRNAPTIALSFHTNLDSSASPDSESDGPNANGTYSREYTLKHPEILWVHRGQGRYRPEGSVTEQSRQPSSQDLLVPIVNSGRRGRSSNSSERSLLELPEQTRHISPRATRLSDRRRLSDQAPSSSELRKARLKRRTLPSSPSQDSQSSETPDDDDTDRTYRKSYVDAHKETQFRHYGNGSYRRISSSQSDAAIRVTRRTSSRSFATSEASPIESPELKPDKHRHRGSVSSRPLSPLFQNTYKSSAADGSASPVEMTDTFSKAEMLAEKALHPDIVFVHRGNGRYKRADDIANESVLTSKMDAQSNITYNKAYVDSHPDENFYHTGHGRYKKGTRASKVPTADHGNELPSGLVTRKYVDEHPELIFHHRGQGRWAPGPRGSISTKSNTPGEEEPRLVDKDYVDAHPNETFHHRGQGRWAKGLPPPGSSNKMAIRGPGTQEQREVAPPASEPDSTESANGLPGLFDLVRKEEGPAAFPDVQWFYRGGGKWARLSKDAAEAQQRAAQTVSRLRAQVDTQRVDESAPKTRRGSLTALAPPVLKRKHSALQTSEVNDSSQQSGESTPRPRMLTLEEDQLNDEDLPDLYGDQWSPSAAEDDRDEAAQILRQNFRPLNEPDAFIASMTKLDLSTRPIENLYVIAAHVQKALQQMQDEYVELDRITAPHARIPRKVATGGRLPVQPQLFEDRKEADLYDYQFDAKRIGYQDPEGQKISRDVDGRELRKRRKRGELDADSTPAEPALPRRAVKPVERFEGVPGSTSRRSRLADASSRGSMTPDRVGTPDKVKTTPDTHVWADNYVAPKSGRWANHVPKRIKELRGGSAGLHRSDVMEDVSASADEDESTASSTTPTKPATTVIHSIESEMEIDDGSADEV